MKSSILGLGFFFWQWSMISTAQPSGLLQQLPEEEQAAIEAIALYPEKERTAVLQASLHPEILVRMENIRKATEIKYREKIQVLPEEDQKKMYNLVRYTELLDVLCKQETKPADRELDDILENYPEEIVDDARYCTRKHFETLKSINQLYVQANDVFTEVLSTYPQPVRQSYEELAMLPGVVTILAEHMSMTVLLGDIYRNNPDRLIKELDSLNVIVAEERSKELAEWKKELEENPEAMKEYEAAAQEFADEQGYDNESYTSPAPDVYTNQVYIDYIWRPYPYWFGWPYWYSYPCWYPYPWWYHWGYYYGPGDAIVVVGLPSGFFVNWHFYYGHHYYYYPHFTDQVIRHYYGPRHTGAVVQPVLRTDGRSQKSVLPEDWFKNPENRIVRIKEYGKFKMDYDEAVRVSVDKAPSEKEFLKTNVDRYPTMKPLLKEKEVKPQPPPAKPREYEPYPVRKPDPDVPREKVIEKEKVPRTEEVDRAKEIHEKAWDKIRTSPKTSPQSPPRQTSPMRQPPQKSTAPPRQKN